MRAVAVVTAAFTIAGMAMAHAGHGFTVRYGDRIVLRAGATSPILRAYRDHRLKTAAALDAFANLVAGTATMLAGYFPPGVYPIAAYRAWVGGIVSIDRNHRSRLADPFEAAYYIVVLVLQLVPYTLLAGAGVNLGRARVRPADCYQGAKRLGLPVEALRDTFSIWLLCVPLFAIASAIEFLSPR